MFVVPAGDCKDIIIAGTVKNLAVVTKAVLQGYAYRYSHALRAQTYFIVDKNSLKLLDTQT